MEIWLGKTSRYRDYALRNLEWSIEAYDLVCFLAQQSAEFLLKAFLAKETGARPLTHSLYEMAKRLAQIRGIELDEGIARCAKFLEQHSCRPGIPTRG
ncbi:MAG: HEPN domain-containing protein [Thermoproteus sp.]